MKAKIDCAWKEGQTFEAEVNGFKIMLDTACEAGGQNLGPRPKQLILVALAGCTGMDVISILRKMKSEPEYFNVAVEADSMDEHPKYFKKINVIYELKGKDINIENVNKAINLSRDRYCSVYAMLKHGAEITYEIRILE
jgi:putative redox protein